MTSKERIEFRAYRVMIRANRDAKLAVINAEYSSRLRKKRESYGD